MYNYEELDDVTRKWMLEEFKKQESSGIPYGSPRLSRLGLKVVPALIKNAIEKGNEETLVEALSKAEYWNPSETYVRNGKLYERRINPIRAAEFLGRTEFTTWYTTGFARRLLDEGEEECEVYRVAPVWKPRVGCLQHEGKRTKVKDVYEGHRIRYCPYCPPPGEPTAFSIPCGTNCHHSIRRIS